MLNMLVKVRMICEEENYFEEIIVQNVVDPNNFSFIDKDSNSYEISIYDDGMRLNCDFKDHKTILNLLDSPYIKVISEFGELIFDTKVVAFKRNGDILVMHYSFENIQRVIEVEF